MHSIDQAIDELGRIVGLPDLAFDAEGNLSLLFDETMPVNIARIDETSMELWTTLDDIGRESDVKLVRHLLSANHLGRNRTGAARLALQPGGGSFLLCERFEIAGLDAATLERRFSDFVENAFYWNSPDARDAISHGDSREEPLNAGGDFGIRV